MPYEKEFAMVHERVTMNQQALHTEIEIDASPEEVWAILTDFAAYPSWNPFITAIQGVPEHGAVLRVQLRLNEGKPMTLRPRVLAARAPQEFRWLGKLLFRGIFDGEHRFTIEETPRGGSIFRQDETFSGILVPIFRGSLLRKTRVAFEAMNQALKVRAENMQKRTEALPPAPGKALPATRAVTQNSHTPGP